MNEELDFSYRVTGTMISYYYICHRKLWLFYNKIDMEQINPTSDVVIGRILSGSSFKYEKRKETRIDDSVIDFLTFKGIVVVHETKKSKSFESAHIWQVKYYIYLLKKYGIDVSSGVIHYPRAMRKIEVKFTRKDEKIIRSVLEKISNVISRQMPPPVLNKSFCKRCSYFELCYV